MSATIASGGTPAGAAAGSRILTEAATPYLVLAGRVFLSAIFLLSGINKLTDWSGTADHMAHEGMVAVPLMLAGAVAVELAAGGAVLFGCYARVGALALAAFLVPTTLIFHDFWAYSGDARMNQMQHFMKNLTIVGGLLVLAAYGAGRYSFDARGRGAPDAEPRQSGGV